MEHIIERLKEYFDDRMDADHDGERFVPNEEMRMYNLVEELEELLNKQKQIKWTTNLN